MRHDPAAVTIDADGVKVEMQDGEPLCGFRVLSQNFALERIALLAAHLHDVERIIRSGDTFDRSFGRR